MGMKPNIELHIEELVLHGFMPCDRDCVGRALKSELARLLAEGGPLLSLARNTAIDSLNAGHFEVGQGAKPQTLGTQVALAIYRGLAR